MSNPADIIEAGRLLDRANAALSLWREWFEKSGDNPQVTPDVWDHCFFCGNLREQHPAHVPDCIYLRAKALVEKGKGEK